MSSLPLQPFQHELSVSYFGLALPMARGVNLFNFVPLMNYYGNNF